MLTTASITRSATSAMFSGPRAAAGNAQTRTIAVVSAATAKTSRDERNSRQDMEVYPPEGRVVEGVVRRSSAGRKGGARGATREPDRPARSREVAASVRLVGR